MHLVLRFGENVQIVTDDDEVLAEGELHVDSGGYIEFRDSLGRTVPEIVSLYRTAQAKQEGAK